MGAITFNKANNRLKRVLAGQDHYSALVFYSNTLPAGFSTNNRIQAIADITAAENLGILATGSILLKIMHYHISELFRLNPDAVLWVGVFAEPATGAEFTFVELDQVRIFANGTIRQMGVWGKKAFVTAEIALLQSRYNAAFAAYAPYEIYYCPNLVGVDTDSLQDVGTLNSPNVHLVAAQDGAALGASLFTTAATYSVGVIGAQIGATSLAKVNENTGWVEKFNMAVAGGELDVPALANGELISGLSENITKSGGTLDTKRLIFLIKYPSYTGTYFNDTHGCCLATDDYAYAEDNRTIDKAIRGIYLKLLPQVNGPVLLDAATGELSQDVIDFLTLEASKALEEMEKAQELSGYTVTIDPNQDVNATSQIVINVSNEKVGVSRNLIINIGY